MAGVGVAVTGARWIVRFTDNTRLADAYRRGRVLLAGEAAHVHFPAGGQGLNLGLQDAAGLGWRLAAVVQGHADVTLFDGYQRERHPVAARALELSRAQVQLMRPEAAAVRELVGTLLDAPDAAHRLAGTIAGLDIAYPRDPDAHPLTGRFAPDTTWPTPSGPIRLAERLRSGRFQLVVPSGSAPGTVPGAVPGPVDVLEVPGPVFPEAEAVLVRPDGYIAWAVSGDS